MRAKELSDHICRNILAMRKRNLRRICNSFRKLVGENIFFSDLRAEVALIRGHFIKTIFNFVRV